MITQTQFDLFKADALAKQPLRRRCSLSDLKFQTMDVVEFQGITLGITRQGLKDIVRLIGFSQSGSAQLSETLGEESAVNILNSLKAYMSSQKQEVTIVVTPDRCITQVTPTAKTSTISAETFFDTFERIANRHNLEIQSMSFNEETGGIGIQSLAGKSEFQIPGLSDEVFRTGLSFSRTMDGIQADPYQHRLVCTNGMITRQFEESYKLRSMEPKMWEEFYRHLDRIEKADFVPQRFTASVMRSQEHLASFAEVERACSLLLQNSSCQVEDLEIFFKGLKTTHYRFAQSGIDTTQLVPEQKKGLRTGIRHWDLINGITDFASHDYGYEKKPNCDRHLQVVAGDLLSKTPDTSNLILVQPF